ncbi:MAG: hypothetical protein ACI4D5_03910 [Kineothrix sp.]
MRKYLESKKELLAVVCNNCGKDLLVENGIIKEGCFDVTSVFGYFSRKDGQIHSFDLCEDCYDRMIAGFRIPVDCREAKEML